MTGEKVLIPLIMGFQQCARKRSSAWADSCRGCSKECTLDRPCAGCDLLLIYWYFFFQINAVLCEIVHIAIRIASQVLTRTHALPTCKDVDVSTLLATR